MVLIICSLNSLFIIDNLLGALMCVIGILGIENVPKIKCLGAVTFFIYLGGNFDCYVLL